MATVLSIFYQFSAKNGFFLEDQYYDNFLHEQAVF
jgi:hypothetical protein